MINKGKIKLIISLILLLISISIAQGVQVLERKIIFSYVTNYDMHRAKLLFNDHNDVFVSMHRLLYTNDNLIKMDVPGEYCCRFLGGFIKDGQSYVSFESAKSIDVYSVREKLCLVSHMKPLKFSGYSSYDKVIAIPERNNTYYLFGHYEIFPSNPIEKLRTLTSAGHGVYYKKPLLAEIQNNQMVRYIKLPYGGKIDESYVVEETIAGEDSIHFLGFRNIDVPFIESQGPERLVDSGPTGYGLKEYNFKTGDYYGNRDITRSVILYYADYNLEKEKNMREHTIYKNTPGYDKSTDAYSDYGVLSIDSKEDDIFAVFSWFKQRRSKKGFKIEKEVFIAEDVNSDIYYWQCRDKSYDKAEKIAEGFCPLVRVDQFGNVHIFWIDRSGNVIQKTKKDDKWDNGEIILGGVITKPAILYTKFFAAEFDKNNNLHAVYPTAEGIVYTKLKLE